MSTADDTHGALPRGNEILNDLLNEDLLQLEAGDRLWKLYCIRPADGVATDLRHRIYTKQKPDGTLSLVTFAVHNPGGPQTPPVRSAIARVASLTPEALDHIITAIRKQTSTEQDRCDEVDLRNLPTVEAQIEAVAGSD